MQMPLLRNGRSSKLVYCSPAFKFAEWLCEEPPFHHTASEENAA
jgi:hypothetical protein